MRKSSQSRSAFQHQRCPALFFEHAHCAAARRRALHASAGDFEADDTEPRAQDLGSRMRGTSRSAVYARLCICRACGPVPPSIIPHIGPVVLLYRSTREALALPRPRRRMRSTPVNAGQRRSAPGNARAQGAYQDDHPPAVANEALHVLDWDAQLLCGARHHAPVLPQRRNAKVSSRATCTSLWADERHANHVGGIQARPPCLWAGRCPCAAACLHVVGT